ILTFQNHTNRPLTDFGGKTSIFSHPVYLFLREFSLQDFRGGSILRDAHLFGQDLISGSGKSGLYFWPVLLFTLFQRSTVDIETPQNSATCFVVIKLFIAAPPAVVQLKDSCACA
ncbi:hypothetical protein NHH33_22995, partial [Escherichia albertii]|uniref:hypothetical protein n=1 Tax=Escherichia albertii TaxID=208962 RepID=UPI002119E583